MKRERWLPVVGFPAYAVSSHGRVKRVVIGAKGQPCKILGTWHWGHSYEMVGLSRDGVNYKRLVHRLVCEAFHGPAPTPEHQVAHNDGTRTNHHASNLRWATRSENMRDCIIHGTQATGERHGRTTKPEKTPRGERHGHAKLTEKQVRAIRRARVYEGSGVALAEKYGVSPASICNIRSRKTWVHI